MSVGRYFCVALPFILTVVSIICMLIAGLTGVVNNKLYMFQVNTTDFSIDTQQLADMINNVSADWGNSIPSITSRDAIDDALNKISANGENLTAEDLGLPNLYDVTLWGYCSTWQNGTRSCTDAQFDWASTYVTNGTLDTISDNLGSIGNINITLPDGIDQSITVFQQVSKWTQIVYIIAMVALGLELVVGLFTACSRAISCITWIISGFATLATIAAAAMMTATAAVVVGVAEGTGKLYGVSGSFNDTFLAVIWLGAAFALAASAFWLFSVCCCKPESRPHKSKHQDEKFPPMSRAGSAYHPIGEHQQQNNGYSYGGPQRGGARSDMAYEPYSHSNV